MSTPVELKPFTEYYAQIMEYTFYACALGILLEKITILIEQKFKLKNFPALLLFIQVSLNIILFYIIEKYIYSAFISDLQTYTAGLYFTSMFFGVQASLYTSTLALMNLML